MSGNPSFSQFGVDAMNGYFMAASGNGLLGAADVPLFHPAMAPPDHGGGGGFGSSGDAAAMDIGVHFAANNLVLASLASQLFGSAPAAPHGHGDYVGARTPQEEEMGGGYGVAAVGDSPGAVSLACLGQSDDMAVGWSSASKKASCNWSNAGGSRTAAAVQGSYYLARVPEAAGFVYPLDAGHSAATPASELSLSLCSNSSSDSMINAGDQCSSAASRSGLTQMSRVEPELPLLPYCPQACSRPATNFAAVVARSRYAAFAQQVLNDAVGCVLAGVADAAAAAADSASAVDSGSRPSSCSVAGAPSSAVSSNNQLIAASSGEHPHGGGGDAQRLRSELLSMLQLMDHKYNQCLDEIQSTTARFNSLTHAAERAAGMGSGGGGGSICAPFAHRAVSAMYYGLRRRIAGEIMAAAPAGAGMACRRGGESSSAVTGERERSWESAFIQKHWAVQQLRRGEQQCWRPQRGLPEKSVAVLKAWMFENFLRPYPKDSEKEMLAARSGLSRNQVSNWFINARVRLWKPMIEEMCEELKRSSGASGGSQALAMEHLNSQDVIS
ncbi:homeobox protein ATH1-like isoform X2 [Oryza brachyantha]|nr:homeobox protein ATH1-like isoform X2 [Oryza brachyantha]XP_040377019.1 homeobox protein ATH1-like isoform X2 [Oryza brachyantha]